MEILTILGFLIMATLAVFKIGDYLIDKRDIRRKKAKEEGEELAKFAHKFQVLAGLKPHDPAKGVQEIIEADDRSAHLRKMKESIETKDPDVARIIEALAKNPINEELTNKHL
jgi:hypothetical protein